MARGEEPELSQNRPSSENSDDREVEEEDALLTGSRARPSKYGWPFWREVGIFTWALLATVIVIILAVMYQHKQTARSVKSGDGGYKKPSGKRNLIFMVSDGMGPTSLSLTRSFRQTTNGLPIDDVLVLDQHLIGSSRTRSTSSLITDSAAGATAFSCGAKSYNGAISVLPDHTACGTVLEAAKQAGYMTGLVVTTRITDATPACFAAHVNKRNEEDRIAEQEVGEYPLGRVVDLLLGGGRCHFLPNSTEGSCRKDNRDIVQLAKDHGFSYVDSREDFDGLNFGSAIKLPLLGLFADHDIPYEIDRRTQGDVYPSLDEMARTALRALSDATQDSDKGFFLMIEGSRIDHAGHANDPAAQVHEVMAYDAAFASVLDFLEKDPVDGIVVGTSDHETGGLATARQLHTSYPEYHWFPAGLANASHSAEHLAYQLHHHISGHQSSTTSLSTISNPPKYNREDLESYIRSSLIQQGLGIHDASDEEVARLLDNSDPWPSSYLFADMISRRAQVGWTTHGHSAVDVNIYASNPDYARPLVGNHENTEIGDFLAEYLDVDVRAVTRELKEKGTGTEMGKWMGAEVGDERAQAEWHDDHYAGDFKRKRDGGCGCGR